MLFPHAQKGLDVAFDAATDRAGRSGTFDCGLVLTSVDGDAAASDALLGKGATCSFAADDLLKVGVHVEAGIFLRLLEAVRKQQRWSPQVESVY